MSLKLELSEGQINNAIAVALAESFTEERKTSLIRDLVRSYLTVRENPYDKETLLSKTIGAKVRELARVQLDKEIESMRGEVEAAVSGAFTPELRASVVDQVKKAISHVAIYNLHVTATVEDS